MACNGLKMGSFHLFRHRTANGLGSFLEKHIFDPFLPHFWSQNSPFSRHFGALGGVKRATTSSKSAKNTCFGIPCGPRSFLKKVIFSHPVNLVDPSWHPPLWATSCSLPQPIGPRYGGLGVGWGNFEGWKPPKVGGCGWIRCARNRALSHVAQDMVCFWFLVWGCGRPMCTNFGAFGGLLGEVRGHIVELEGPRGPFGTGKSRCMCRVATISLNLAGFSGFEGRFEQKKG